MPSARAVRAKLPSGRTVFNRPTASLIFTDRIELFIPPKKGSRHILRLIRELLAFEMPERRTNIPLALDYLDVNLQIILI